MRCLPHKRLRGGPLNTVTGASKKPCDSHCALGRWCIESAPLIAEEFKVSTTGFKRRVPECLVLGHNPKGDCCSGLGSQPPLQEANMRHRIASLISLLIALLVCATASYAQTKSGGLSAMDVFNLEAAGDPQISPDGTRVVYVRQFADLMSDRRCSNLWIINFDGTNNRPLTTGNYGDSQPRWSSDGTRIIYVSDRDGTPQIYCRWMDTGQTARITNLQSPPSGIGWSPDGKWVSFTSLVPSAGPHVGPLPSAPPGAKWADPPVVVDKLVYRFNGAGYLKPGFYHVFVVSSEGGTPRQITNGDIPHGGPGLRASDAVWTPDSKYLL